MPKFVVERSFPGAGALTTQELQGIAQKGVDVQRELGPDVQWVNSYLTGDAIFCVYNARDEAVVREHARLAGFPCDRVSRVSTVIDPTTAEG